MIKRKSPAALILCFLILFGFVSNANASSLPFSAAIGGAIVKQFETGKLKINKIVVGKPNIFQPDELNAVLAKYEGREITIDELRHIQTTLSKYYYESGYVNSGVIIPDQTIKNGVIHIDPVQGRLSRVRVSGNHAVSKIYIYNTLKKGISVPLNVRSLQQSLVELRQDPLIANVKARLLPGEQLGQSILMLDIKEKSPYFLNIEANNYKPVSIGQYSFMVNGGHRNLTGLQDTLKANVDFAQGLQNMGLDYSVPLQTRNIRLFANYNYAAFQVVDSVFSKLDVGGSTTSLGAGLSIPLIRSTQIDFSIRGGMDYRHMTYSIAGDTAREPSSSPVYMALDASIKRATFAGAISMGERHGLKLGSTNQQSDLRSFDAGVGQLYMAYRPFGRIEWIVNLNGQLALNELPAVEKFAMGGANSVKGYRQNIYVRDSGAVALAHVKIPVYRSKVFVLPFVDYGTTWERTDGFLGGNSRKELLSVGLGMQWHITKAFYSEFSWGTPLIDVKGVEDQQQSGGVYAMLNYKVF